jgi:hypothetical protein
MLYPNQFRVQRASTVTELLQLQPERKNCSVGFQARSAGLQTGVPNDRSSSLGWETGCRAGLQTRAYRPTCQLADSLTC